MTHWAKDVDPAKPLPEYPRPQLVRKRWQNLNGLWELAISPKDGEAPGTYTDRILVPYPVESALSGAMKRPDQSNHVWYRRSFAVPKSWRDGRVLLHFGAVDWESVVWVNGKRLGEHKGGYDPFTFDVTDALTAQGPQELVLRVWDPTDTGTQPRGKQVQKPGGICYTPTTGIWQTVWIEPVPKNAIAGLTIVPDVDDGVVRCTVAGSGLATVDVLDGTAVIATRFGPAGEELVLPVPNARLWSPESPHLYGLRVTLGGVKGSKEDTVESYFGMRKVSVGKDERGVTRLMLNDKPIFMSGPLDQGFWPDGLYTAPTDRALKYDIEVTKQLGFNMARKHVKVEPARWYYWCDKLGLLVWQDMPHGDAGRAAQQFETELRAMIAANFNSPSIVMWVVFNEGWGQHDTPRFVELVRKLDPTRLINNASGWTDQACGDVMDWHVYPGPGSPLPEPKRAAVLGEYGGLGLPIKGHAWQEKDNWGYQSYADRAKLGAAILDLLQAVRTLKGEPGLSAAVYTQTTDVETESNGLLTYDRAMIKGDPKLIRKANEKLYLPPPTVVVGVPNSQAEAQTWRYTTERPADGWEKPAFADASWLTGQAGFGQRRTPGSVVRTEWTTNDIWLRRNFSLAAKLKNPHLTIHHDEDAEIYIDGKLAMKLSGFATRYNLVALPRDVARLLGPGPHTLAVHCKQVNGGQYIDVGLVGVEE